MFTSLKSSRPVLSKLAMTSASPGLASRVEVERPTGYIDSSEEGGRIDRPFLSASADVGLLKTRLVSPSLVGRRSAHSKFRKEDLVWMCVKRY